MKTGARLIREERERQIGSEGFTFAHDDEHDNGQLATAAACYAAPFQLFQMNHGAEEIQFQDPWPFERRWDGRRRLANGYRADFRRVPTAITPKERIRELVKAGALLAAEIDRINRTMKRSKPKQVK